MQRQKSILSFFQKPLPEDQKCGGSSAADTSAGRSVSQFPAKQRNQNFAVADQPTFQIPKNSSLEITGTDTPPEKVPRQMIPASFTTNDDRKAASSSSSLFSSIMHKFVKVDERESSCESDCEVLPKEGNVFHNDAKESGFNSTKQVNQVCSLHSESGDDDIIGPETPGMRPFVPRLKRIQEDNFENKNECSLLDSSKRLKLLQNSTTGNKNYGEVSDTTSKFEWLDPSRRRDANRRRPGDALYDKRTLYIPPDALKKMSASQKQYWSIKCQYMDVVLFFKVGKFYELYELDAEIGHKELDWKMTFSGVGKCRQVGISESGIDEAVQKLIARGYKVGRIEQLETSEQAKARGSTSVIQRKLVHVVTPSTACDGNIGPDAVHLLSVKEGNDILENGSVVYGFAFVDCAALKFWIGSISDDASCAALGALLMQVSPKEVIYENQELSKEAQKALKKYSLSGFTALKLTPLPLCTDFVDASKVRNLIHLKGYFKGSGNSWDHALDGVMHHDLALCALGGLLGHLSRLKLDDTLRNGDILPYQVYSGCLRMDGQTLVNLEIFSNNADGGSSGKCSLFSFQENT
ncbi:hypothetical protein PVL29_014237 [Vitis rotundifolia]|uniref:DNA mismatch repair protein MSH7 n=1 Tax=Vitis rotundifolia TaxID=103349 RepID=A0AA38ZGH4_VITRO|nr:hypothetical protein PVL29_014237 [Vitis rotundifolia]